MTDLIKSDWTELDSNNINPSPNGVQVGYAPSTVAPILRTIRGALKRFYVQSNAVYTTTGTGAAYTLTYAVAPEGGYSTGIIYRFYAHADNTGAATLNINLLGAKSILSQHGEPLTAGKIKAGKVIELVYNGTSFELISNEVHDPKFTGNTSLANLSVSGSSTLASSISMTGANQGLELGPPGTTNTPFIDFHSGASSTDYDARIIASGGTAGAGGGSLEFTCATLTKGGSTIWHAGNDGSGSTLDSDLLDGQHGSYYQNASNINAGTLADARLPATMSGKTFTSSVTASPSFYASGDGNRHYWFSTAAGTARGVVYHDNVGEAININLYNTAGTYVRNMSFSQGGIATWQGTQFKVSDAIFANDGNLWMPWAGDWLSNVLATKITTDGRAYPRRVGGVDLNFNWSGQSGQPSWLWGGNDGTNMYVYNPSNFSVAYSANSGALNGQVADGVVSSGMAGRPVGGVGTYAFLWNEVSETVNPGDTRAGSQLTYASGNTQAAGTSPAGTWRCMGRNDTGSTTPRLSVWMRIS